MKHIKECALPTCNKKFETNRKWQIFCCRDHQKDYWREYRYSENQVKREFNKRLEEVEKKLGMDK